MSRAVTHTLGPVGTNCEAAAWHWLRQRGYSGGEVELHSTLEEAVPAVLRSPKSSILLACIVYPQLNELVFRNLTKMALRECFTMPTHPMVLAAPKVGHIGLVLSHPAPASLLDGREVLIKMANSNSAAAIDCAKGLGDACITTKIAAETNGLLIIEDFGAVPMGFSIHVPYGSEVWPYE